MKAFDEGDLRPTAEDLLTAENTDWHRLGFDSPAFEDNQHGQYFPIESWEAGFDDVYDFCEGNDPLLVIPSIPGSGKSTFLNQYVSQLQDPLQIHYLKARSIFSLRHLLNAISENFPQFSNVSTNTDNFINELRSVAKEAGPQLLIIDDAQRLSKETLAGLLQIVAGQDLSDLWLRVILCGEPQLEDRVQSLFDELEFAFSFNAIVLDALDVNETRAYIKHRLDEAGFKEKFPFSKSMVKHIHTLSSGFPGRINRVAQQVLIDMAKNQQLTTTQSGSAGFFDVFTNHKVKITSITLLLFAAFGLWFLQQNQSVPVFHQQTVSIPIASQQYRAENKTGDISVSEQRMLQNKPMIHRTTYKPIAIKVHEKAITMPEPTPIKPTLSVPVQPEKRPQIQPALENTLQNVQVTTIESSVPVIEVKTQVKPQIQTKAKPQPQQPTLKDKQSQNKQAIEDNFTIQLIGVHDKAKLVEYIKTQHLGAKAAYYQSNLHGKPWFVLTYGQYKTADEAHNAIKLLPTAIQAQKPWVKLMSTIHSPLVHG